MLILKFHWSYALIGDRATMVPTGFITLPPPPSDSSQVVPNQDASDNATKSIPQSQASATPTNDGAGVSYLEEDGNCFVTFEVPVVWFVNHFCSDDVETEGARLGLIQGTLRVFPHAGLLQYCNGETCITVLCTQWAEPPSGSSARIFMFSDARCVILEQSRIVHFHVPPNICYRFQVPAGEAAFAQLISHIRAAIDAYPVAEETSGDSQGGSDNDASGMQ